MLYPLIRLFSINRRIKQVIRAAIEYRRCLMSISFNLSAYKYSNINSVDVSFDKNDISFLDKIGHEDIVFNALHGGSGENGDIQAMLERKGFSYTGSDSKSSKIVELSRI